MIAAPMTSSEVLPAGISCAVTFWSGCACSRRPPSSCPRPLPAGLLENQMVMGPCACSADPPPEFEPPHAARGTERATTERTATTALFIEGFRFLNGAFWSRRGVPERTEVREGTVEARVCGSAGSAGLRVCGSTGLRVQAAGRAGAGRDGGGRGTGRAAYDERRRGEIHIRSGAVLDDPHQGLRGRTAPLGGVGATGGQWRVGPGRQRYIVEPHDRQVVRQPKPDLLGDRHAGSGRQVVGVHDRGRPAAALIRKRVARAPPSAVNPPDSTGPCGRPASARAAAQARWRRRAWRNSSGPAT